MVHVTERDEAPDAPGRLAAPGAAVVAPLRLRHALHGGRAVLAVHGEVDLCTAPQLRAALRGLVVAAGPPFIVVDLEGCPFMDARGIGVLAEASDLARRGGGQLSLAHPPGVVRKMLEVLALEGVLPIEQGKERRPPADS